MSSSWLRACEQARAEFGSRVYVPSKKRNPRQYARAVQLHRASQSGGGEKDEFRRQNFKDASWSTKGGRERRRKEAKSRASRARGSRIAARRRMGVPPGRKETDPPPNVPPNSSVSSGGVNQGVGAVGAGYPVVSQFKEAVECAYYDMRLPSGRDVRILFLGEYHEVPSAEDMGVSGNRPFIRRPNTESETVKYLHVLNLALTADGRCLDVYAEDRFRRNTMARANAGTVQLGGSHARSMLYSYTDPQTRFDGVRGRRSHFYDQREMATMAGGSQQCIPTYGCNGRTSTVFSVDEYIAMYYGIGPHTTNGGEPDQQLSGKWMAAKRDVERSGSGEVAADLAYMKKLRLRNRLGLRGFLNANPSVSQDKIMYVMRVIVAGAGRFRKPPLRTFTKTVPTQGIGATPVGGMVVEAFADLAGFFRMFRVFDASKHPATGACQSSGAQTDIVWLSHMGHSMRAMQLIAMVFGELPTYQDGELKDTILSCTKALKDVADRYDSGRPVPDVPYGQLYRTDLGGDIIGSLDDGIHHSLDTNGNPTHTLTLSNNGTPFFQWTPPLPPLPDFDPFTTPSSVDSMSFEGWGV